MNSTVEIENENNQILSQALELLMNPELNLSKEIMFDCFRTIKNLDNLLDNKSIMDFDMNELISLMYKTQ